MTLTSPMSVWRPFKRSRPTIPWLLAGMVAGAALVAPAWHLRAAVGTPADLETSLFGDDVVARGTGFEIKRSLLNQRYYLHQANLAARGGEIPDEERPEVERQLLEKLATHGALRQRATPEDLAQAQRATSEEIAKLKSQTRSEASYRRQLLAVGMDEATFRQHLLENAINDAVIQRELSGSINVADSEITEFYQQNPEIFVIPERVRIRHILLSTTTADGKKMNESQKQQRRQLAEQLARKAQRGESFPRLVREHSNDRSTNDKGGELTFSRKDAVPPTMTAAALSMTPGQISDVVTTRFGFHVIKLEEKIPSEPVPLDKVRDQVVAELKRLKLEASLEPYLERVRQEAEIEYML